MCVSGKYLMAGGETPSKQSREQRVGNTTAGQCERRKQRTNRLPTSEKQQFVSSKDAFASPGEFSELQHLLCGVLNIPKESSKSSSKLCSTTQPQQTELTYSVQPMHLQTFRSGSHLDKNRYFPAF